MSRIVVQIETETPPMTRDALSERILRLRKALIAARAARVGLADSLARVRAAAKFAYSHADSRQDLAVSPKS